MIPTIWERLSRGEHVGVAGDRLPPPPAGWPLVPLRVGVSSGGPGRGPLFDALGRLTRSGEGAGLLDAASMRLRQGVRLRLLGDEAFDPDAALVDAINRTAGALRPLRALVLDGIDRADEATIHLLRRAVASPSWLRLPVLMVFRTVPLDGPAADLAADLGVEGVPGEETEEVLDADAALSPRAAITLRAAATIGETFESEAIGDLTGASPIETLLDLQEALDAGFPIVDLGAGVMTMPPDLARALRHGVLTGLRQAWAERLAEHGRAASATPSTPEREAAPRAPVALADVPDIRDAQAERALREARQASLDGRTQQALTLAARALSMLEDLPASPRRRRLRIEVYADLAQYKREMAGTGPGTRLNDALVLAEGALALLEPSDPPVLAAGVHALVGALSYDLGDPKSLEKSLDAFTSAVRMLEAAGEPIAAARLLNDQAAVWIRLGDPVRATHLLKSSREVFEARAESDPDARIEMAETDHLLARLPLHVAARAGLGARAVEMALGHAEHAAATYEDLERIPELARVWETMGRLELLREQLEAAAERLLEAIAIQQKIGDVVGLARTTAALSDGLARAKRIPEALSLLADSIELNLRQGTPIGLAHNRAALEVLRDRLGADPRLAEAAGHVEKLLDKAESIVGRAELASISR